MSLLLSADSTLALNYSFDTHPAPLQVSPAGGSTHSSVTVVISNPDPKTPVALEGIQIALPTGSEAAALTDNPSSIENVSVSPSQGWSVSYDGSGAFTITPAGSGPVTMAGNGLALQFSNLDVNHQVGTASISIREKTTSGAGEGSYKLPKFPPGFYLGDLRVLSEDNRPISQAAYGDNVTLRWDATLDTSLELYFAGQTVDVTNADSYDTSKALKNGLERTTTFVLRASASEGPVTVSTYRSVTLPVTQPALDAHSLVVENDTTLKGPATLEKTLATQGAASLDSLTVGHDASVKGSLGVSRDTTISGNAAVSGTASVGGTLSANGGLHAGSAVIDGPVQAFGAPKSLSTGTHRASSDGVVLGTIQAYNVEPKKLSICWIWGGSDGVRVDALGGNTIAHMTENGKHWQYANAPSSFLLPVRKGSSFYLSQKMSGDNEANPLVAFHFYPLGKNESDTPVVERIDTDTPSVDENTASGQQVRINVDDNVPALTELLEKITGSSIDDEQQERLAQVLRRMIRFGG